jgi:hypothetical protein
LDRSRYELTASCSRGAAFLQQVGDVMAGRVGKSLA